MSPTAKTTTKTTTKTDAPAEGEPTLAFDPVEMVDIGEAAATGELAYAGEPSPEVTSDVPPEETPGTPEHLAPYPLPYAGPRDERDEVEPKP